MPTVKVRYFGRLVELLNAKREEYEVEDGATLADLLLKYIPERHARVSKTWRETIFRTTRSETLLNIDGTPLLRDYLILIGGKSPSLSYKLNNGEEVALLPPFGGGYPETEYMVISGVCDSIIEVNLA
jgi:molybdopterin converting factor small subunit